MSATPNNPPTNKLGSGISERDVLDAVLESGYPLQTTIGNLLRPQFHVQEEWSYIDGDSGEPRTIDILAEKWLYDFSPELRVHPTLDLIIECKKSVLPYVFFLSLSKVSPANFPLLAGLFHNEEIAVTSDDDPSTWNLPILEALGLGSHPFKRDAESCMSFTQCMHEGAKAKLGGSEPFHKLVLPILKAMYHFQEVEAPHKAAMYFDLHLVLGIGVLDAPMVGVRVSANSHDVTLLPWVRVIRHKTEEIEGASHWHPRTGVLLAIDVVHRDFFEDYLYKHLKPFAMKFSELVIKHQEVLASGKGFITDMGKDPWKDFEKRLEPRRVSKTVGRHASLMKLFLQFLAGKTDRKKDST